MTDESTDISKLKCQTCKYWEPDVSGNEWGVRSLVDAPENILAQFRDRSIYNRKHEYIRSEANTLFAFEDWYLWGECSLCNMENAASPDILAVAVDGSEFRAELKTKYNFGCINWELFEGNKNNG